MPSPPLTRPSDAGGRQSSAFVREDSGRASVLGPGQPPGFLCPAALRRMSALGQKRTSRPDERMSALPPKADMDQSGCDVRFVPKADIDGLRGPLAERFRQKLCRIPSIVKLMPFSSLVGLPMFTVRFREIFLVTHAER